MTIQLRPEQQQIVSQAIRAGLIKTADEIVDVAVETIRQRLGADSPTPGPLP